MPTQPLTCPVQLLHPKARVPQFADEHAAGCDLYCVGGLAGLRLEDWSKSQQHQWQLMEENGYYDLYPGGSQIFRTGVAMAIEPGYCCLLWDRSGMGAKRRIHRLAGVIDENYRGEIFVCLVNLGKESQRIVVGDRIIQGIFQERQTATFPVVPTLPPTLRGTNGLGSTGK